MGTAFSDNRAGRQNVCQLGVRSVLDVSASGCSDRKSLPESDPAASIELSDAVWANRVDHHPGTLSRRLLRISSLGDRLEVVMAGVLSRQLLLRAVVRNQPAVRLPDSGAHADADQRKR